MIIGRQRKWLSRLRRPKSLVKTSILVLLTAVVGVGSYQMFVAAEADMSWPQISGGTAWTFTGQSPDPSLTWTYNNSNPGTAYDTVEHVVKNETSSRVRFTKLKLYYDADPGVISIRANTRGFCDFEAPFDGGNPQQIVVTIGSPGRGYEEVYRKTATREGRYSKADGSATGIVARREGFSFEPINNKQDPNYGYFKLKEDNTKDDPAVITPDGLPIPSQICNEDPPAAQYPVYRYEEQCGNYIGDPSNKICEFNGNENYKDVEYSTPKREPTNDPGNSCPPNNCAFNGRILQTVAPRASLSPITGKWEVDVEVELTGPDVSGYAQQMRYFLTSLNGGKFGYRVANSSQEFGLGAEHDAADENNPNGVKLAVPFGIPCDQDPNAKVEPTIYVYDADTDKFGDTYVQLMQRDPSTGGISPVSGSRITAGNFTSPYGNGVKISDGLNKATAEFKLDMQYGMQYMAIIINPKTGGKWSPERNVFSLRLPFESGYGILNCKYELTPSIQKIAPTFSYNPNFTASGDITNNGAAPGGAHEWQVTRITFDRRPLNGHTTIEDNFDPPCLHMASGNAGSGPRNCVNMSGSRSYVPDNEYDDNFSDPADYPPGTTVCFMTSIKKPRWDSNANLWRHSDMTCSVSSIKPKVQVWGGDTKSGSIINTSLTQINGTSYGSWGEYGVASNGRNVGMASGSGLLGGDSNTQSNWSALTFSNSNPFVLGNFGGVMPLAYNPGASTEPDNCNIAARTYGANEKAVIHCAGTLTITGNQSFAATYASITEIPNIKIVADNIIIAAGVDRVDPWLVARSSAGVYGRISTCGQVSGFVQYSSVSGAQLNSNICNTPVKFNGPVIADQLYLYRTSDQKTGDVAAETFNLRANNILSSYNGLGVDQPVARTELITELPPRF